MLYAEKVESLIEITHTVLSTEWSDDSGLPNLKKKENDKIRNFILSDILLMRQSLTCCVFTWICENKIKPLLSELQERRLSLRGN